ncbi:hypothetical protein Tco_1511276, partial [Tanacetum coccineum]
MSTYETGAPSWWLGGGGGSGDAVGVTMMMYGGDDDGGVAGLSWDNSRREWEGKMARVRASDMGDRVDPVVRNLFGFGWKSFPAAAWWRWPESGGGGGLPEMGKER